MSTIEWTGGTITSTYNDDGVQQRGQLASYAFNGMWDKFFSIVESHFQPSLLINSWRLRAPEDARSLSGWTGLHQAAFLSNTPLHVVEKLIKLGAWRLLRTQDDKKQTAYEIAMEYDRKPELVELLKPVIKRSIAPEIIVAFEKALKEIVLSRAKTLVKKERLLMPQLAILQEIEQPEMWFPIPGMYGGFKINLLGDGTLQLESWCRVIGGSGERHIVKPDGSWKLVESGFA